MTHTLDNIEQSASMWEALDPTTNTHNYNDFDCLSQLLWREMLITSVLAKQTL